MKLLLNIQNTYKTTHWREKVIPSVVCSVPGDRVRRLAGRGQILAHHIIFPFSGCQHIRGWRRNSCRIIGAEDHSWESGSQEEGIVGEGDLCSIGKGKEPRWWGAVEPRVLRN